MATGTLPFRGESSGVIFNAILERAPVPAVRLNPDLPPKLEDVINKALEKDRTMRYQHASEIRTDLQRLKRDTDSSRSVLLAAEQVTPLAAQMPTKGIAPTTTGSAIAPQIPALGSIVPGAGRRRWVAGLAIGFMLVLVGAGAFLSYSRRSRGEISSVAVLPFVDASKDPNTEYLSLASPLEIVITDEGSGFNLADVPDPTAIENLERPCGRGLMLMRHYMTEVAFLGRGNIVQMSKLRLAESNGRP